MNVSRKNVMMDSGGVDPMVGRNMAVLTLTNALKKLINVKNQNQCVSIEKPWFLHYSKSLRQLRDNRTEIT